MTNQNKGLVAVFDIDDTLIHSSIKLNGDLIGIMKRCGVEITESEANANRKEWYEIPKKYGISRDKFDAEFNKRKSWEQSLKDGEAPLFPETHDVLSYLQKQDVRLAALSKSYKHLTALKLKHHDLAKYFERVISVTPNYGAVKKHGALYLIGELGPNKIQEAYFIGDKVEDAVLDKPIYDEFGIQSHGILVNRSGKFEDFPNDKHKFHRYWARSLTEVPKLIFEGAEEL